MHLLLTGGVTFQADAFLIGVGAVILFCVAYPLVGVWALLAFPLVFLAALAAKGRR